MNPRSPTTTGASGYPHPPPNKRARHTPPENEGPGPGQGSPRSVEDAESVAAGGGSGGAGGKAGQSSSFRNVSACNRCRLRKNRCDQRLPSCASCEKANIKCVGYDPITKREIPRSYVFYLEARVSYLEDLLKDSSIHFAPAEVFNHSSRPGADPNTAQTPSNVDGLTFNDDVSLTTKKQSTREIAWKKKQGESEKLNKLVSNIGSVTVQGASDSRYLGSTSGISFARVVFAAVKSSVSGTNSEKSVIRPSKPPVPKAPVAAAGTSMRDSFFGLHTKPTIKQAPFPDKEVGRRLVDFYFEHANPQIPILHRGEYMKMFELAYADGDARGRTPRELYMLNIVFAIGSGIFLGDSGDEEKKVEKERKRGVAGRQCQPEEYHASAIVHLESCLSSPSSIDRVDGFGGGLEELQAVLLLAGFALLRPVAPGLWYIVGVAVRLAVDLGLHYEDGKDIDTGLEADGLKGEDNDDARMQRERSAKERGRREWVRDFRRRLWWCTYSFDRLVSTCVGRPFGITDQVITTEFPSLLDDKYITPAGFQELPEGASEPSYKHAAYHYFRLRLLQSEILQVLQHQQAQIARAGGANKRNPYMHTTLPSPFLSKFDSFRSWRIDIDTRLWEWKRSAPTKRETGVEFSVEFLELNYWQCVIMLYRQSLRVPPMFEGEYNTSDEVQSPSVLNVELREDEERVFLKVAEAGQRVLRLYRQLHRVHLVNYTFLATHHLFMAGISFLYAIWHSPIVRSRLTMDEVDFTILAATSVLGDLIEKCPPAEACRDAFDRMSKATVQMCMSTTGFSSSAQGLSFHGDKHEGTPSSNNDYFESNKPSSTSFRRQGRGPNGRPKTTFDMGLNDLLGPVQSAGLRQGTQSNVAGPMKQEFDGFERPQPMRQNTNQSTTSNSNAMPSPSNYASPPLSSVDPSNAAIDPSLLPSHSPHSTFSNLSNPPSGNPNNNNNLPYSQFNAPYQEQQFPFADSAFAGMEFLQGSGWENAENRGEGNGGNGGFNGGDLGMGLGWEGVDHDFSDGGGQLPDLFEGFFFGGTGSY